MENNLRILDFMSTWCSPCLAMKPILEDVEKETGVTIQKINVDEDEEHVIAYGVRNIPTLIFIKDGNIVDRISGTVSKETLLNKIDEYK